jgi:hypothetical protein
MVGYRRDFATLVPKSVPTENAAGQRDAMASMVCSELVVDGIWLNKYVEYVATGDAAISFAGHLKSNPTPADEFFDCYKPPQTGAEGGSK